MEESSNNEKSIILNEFIKFSRKKYAGIPKDETERIMDQITKMLSKLPNPKMSIEAFLQEVIASIYRFSNFVELAVVIQDTKDGLFRYKAFIGYTQEAKKAAQTITYSYDEVIDDTDWPGIKINDVFHIYPAELQSFEGIEARTFNRPSQLQMKREFTDALIEGDFFEFDILGPNKEVFGWIETAHTKDKKMPSRNIVKWLELIAVILGNVIYLIEQAKKK